MRDRRNRRSHHRRKMELWSRSRSDRPCGTSQFQDRNELHPSAFHTTTTTAVAAATTATMATAATVATPAAATAFGIDSASNTEGEGSQNGSHKQSFPHYINSISALPCA